MGFEQIILAITTILLAVGGGFIKSLHASITMVKAELKAEILVVKADAESKRIETRDTLLELVEEKFKSIKESLDDIKRHYNE